MYYHMREQLKIERRRRLPNGKRRKTTVERARNLMTIDFGEDVWGTKATLEEIAKLRDCTVSSLVRDILRRNISRLKRTG
jgi:hypothetical protein